MLVLSEREKPIGDKLLTVGTLCGSCLNVGTVFSCLGFKSTNCELIPWHNRDFDITAENVRG